jgi:diacylglycerol kinase (ATP)
MCKIFCYNINMSKISEKKKFSIVARAKSLTHALRGIGVVIRTEHNFWMHIFIAVIVVLLGILLSISSFEWIFITLSIFLVFAAEAFNTAIEIDMNLTSPQHHPYARDTKDVAAGAVLITSIMAVIIGLIIFIPKVFSLF